MEDQRMWEDLNTDCLVNIFGRVGMESLLLDIPFVCKSWYKASLIPSCWQSIIFPDFSADQTFDFSQQVVEPNTICQRFVSEFRIDKSHFSSTAFMKCIINHSRGKATSITLPAYCTQEAVEFVAHVCPDLVFLDISRYLLFTSSRKLISDLICKWENLEELWLSWSYNLEKILSQISVHCKSFCSLRVSYASSTAFMKCIINHSRGKATSITLPAYCTQEAVEFVAHVCPDLVFLDISRYLLFTSSRKLISDLICKWENLEELWLSWSYNLEKILSQISVHCKSFCSLRVSYASIHKDEALTITTLVPNIKYLNLRSADFDRDSLVSILRSCKSLVFLDVRDCVGFNEADEEILKLSSHISKLLCEGSKEELFIIP